MSFHDRLLAETAAERAAFLATPLIRSVLRDGASPDLYLAFLEQAYHHVRHTCPLLALAASRLGPDDDRYRDALIAYMDEEKGHDEWILDDIRQLGGDAASVRGGQPGLACKAMIGWAYYAVERISPYCLLGMVHVLEGMSVRLAHAAAERLAAGFGRDLGDGFRYLTSHGALDVEHVAFYRRLVDGLPAAAQPYIVEAAKDFYRLYGGIFAELGGAEVRHAA